MWLILRALLACIASLGGTVVKRARRDRVPDDVWNREGFIEATDGNATDYDVIRRCINELAQEYDIREIAVDRWNATQLATQLTGDGFNLGACGQGYAGMWAPAKELEHRILGRELGHDGNPVLRWMASNVSISTDPAGNIKPDKAKSTERIDGIVALCLELGRLTLAEEERESRYSSAGFEFV